MLKLIKMYAVVFNEYTNSSRNDVKQHDVPDPLYLTVKSPGINTAYIIPEHQLGQAMTYGKGFRSLELVGVMTAEFDDPSPQQILDPTKLVEPQIVEDPLPCVRMFTIGDRVFTADTSEVGLITDIDHTPSGANLYEVTYESPDDNSPGGIIGWYTGEHLIGVSTGCSDTDNPGPLGENGTQILPSRYYLNDRVIVQSKMYPWANGKTGTIISLDANVNAINNDAYLVEFDESSLVNNLVTRKLWCASKDLMPVCGRGY